MKSPDATELVLSSIAIFIIENTSLSFLVELHCGYDDRLPEEKFVGDLKLRFVPASVQHRRAALVNPSERTLRDSSLKQRPCFNNLLPRAHNPSTASR